MPMQSFTVKQEHNGAQCQNGDRFIPHRCQFNRHGLYSTKILAESVEEKDILKQVIRCTLNMHRHYQYAVTTQFLLLKLCLIKGIIFCKICKTNTRKL